jgi:RNA processing factor Prp31
MIRASKAVIVSCEEVVSSDEIRQYPERTTIPYVYVSAVVHQPWGAHPTSVYRCYAHDGEHIREYQKAAREGGAAFEAYMEKYIFSCANFDEYLEKALAGEKETAMGADLTEKDAAQIRSYMEKIKALRDERKKIELYLEDLMNDFAPNTSAVIGPIIGARLITAAGGLRKLAGFPSSTVQVIGAEKALFAHLRKGVAPPKHGVIFQHPKLRGAAREKRGKIARKIAAKVSLAAKLDYFKGTFIGDKLAEQLDADIEKITSRN